MSTFNELIDFTRSTTGTYLDSVVYGDELVTNGDFSNGTTGWNFRTETPESGRARLNNTSLGNITYYNQTAVGEVGKVYVLTYDVLATNGETLALQQATDLPLDTTTTGSKRLTFNWSRISGALTIKRLTSNTDVTVDNISVKEVIGGQVSGTPLLKTAAINEPRFEYDAQGNALGLLIEEARTNLLEYSNQANQLSYNADGAATGVDTTEVTSLAGSGTVIKLNKTSGGYGFARVFYGSTTNAQTLSAFVKKGTARYIGFRQLASPSTHTTFDLETNTWVQTVGSTSRGYEDYGNGWIRLWVVSDDSNSKEWASLCITNSGGSESNSETGTVYVYGIQRETGSFPTSYIPTSGSAVTRSADVASLAVSKFGYNQGQFSVVVESDFFGKDSAVSTLCYIGESTDDRVLLYYNSQDVNYQVKSAGSSQAQRVVAGNVSKSAYRYKLNDMVLAGDGNIATTDTSANLLGGTQNNIYIGRYYNGVSTLNGHIKSIQYYPLGLSNAQLQALTS